MFSTASLEVPEELNPFLEGFSIFKNCEIGRDDIREHMEELAERKTLRSRPLKIITSGFNYSIIILSGKGVILRDVFGFCNTLPAAALNRLLRMLLMVAATDFGTKSQLSL